MLNLHLLPIVDREWGPARRPMRYRAHELTAGEMHKLSELVEYLVRVDEALIDYAIAIAGRPVAN